MGNDRGWHGERQRHSEAARKGRKKHETIAKSDKKPKRVRRKKSKDDPLESVRGHKLITKELRGKIPPLYSSEHKSEDEIIVHTKFFTPDSNWTWYVTEFDGGDTFFGLVDGLEVELGYFSLSEIQSTKGPMGLPIERDLYFTPKSLKEVREEVARRRGEI